MAATTPYKGIKKGVTRTVLITGVSRGLGRALALEVAKRGHTVIGCSRTQDMLTSLQSQFPNPDRHLFLNVDVRSNSSLEELARLVVEKNRVPDIIVNNAGTINKNRKIWEVPTEEFDAVIDTNVKGIANVMRNFIPLMIPNKQGIIVNMSSGWGRSAAALCPQNRTFQTWETRRISGSLEQNMAYCASKWAVEGLVRSVAKELPAGMAVVALNPGVINTDMLISCFGTDAAAYQAPDKWALKAATLILNLTAADNGASLTV